MAVKNNALDELLYGDEGKYGYLFPFRDRVPDIGDHIFTNLKQSKDPLDEVVLSRMLDIDYIGWTAKVILGWDLFPIQIAMLQIMWNTPFPMLIACRGGSKCVRGDTLCRTSSGLLQMDEIIDSQSPEMERLNVGCKMQGENGFNQPSYGWNNGVSETKKIRLRSGIEIEVTNNHPIRCMDSEGKIVWRNADIIEVGDYVPVCRDQYNFGNDTTTSEDLGWWLGLMIGDGMFTQRSCLGLSATNKSIIDQFFKVTEKEFDYKPRPIMASGQYNIYSVKIWDQLNDLYDVGRKNSYTKEIPRLIRQSPRNVVAAFIRGLFDADGCISKNRARISYTSCSEALARQVQQILLGFGIVSTLRSRTTRSQNGTEVQSYQITINGEHNVSLYAEHIGFIHSEKHSKIRNRTVKSINPNNDLIPNIQSVMLRLREKFGQYTGGPNKRGHGPKNTLVLSPCRISQYILSYNKLEKFLDSTQCLSDDQDWQYLKQLYDQHYYFDKIVDITDSQCQTFDVHIPDDHSFVSNGLISHNSFMLATYAILRAIIDPGTKIVIVGAGLRQAKLVFGYIDTMWSNSPMLRSIVGGGKKAGPRQNVDLCYFKIGESIIYALPMGDGCSDTLTCVTHKGGFGRISDDHCAGQTKKEIINRCEKIWGNGKFRISDESYCNGMSQTKKITTHHGLEFNATHNHKLKIVRNQQVIWVRMDEMKLGDKTLLDRSTRWHNGNSGITIEEAYGIGLLVGDGSYTIPYRVAFATQDRELAKAVQKIIPIKQIPSDPVHWILSSKPQRNAMLTKFGIHHYKTKDKQFPSTILKSPRNVTSAFISGLFDTDGHVQVTTERGGTQIGITFYNTSKELVRQLQYILLHYGIVAHVKSRKRDDKWEECYELSITGRDVLIFATEIGFRLKRKQDKLLSGIEKKKRWMDQKDDVPGVLEDMTDISATNRARHNTGNCVSVCEKRLKVKKSASRPLVENFLRVYGHIDDPRVDSIRRLADPDVYYDEVVSIEDDECVTFDVHVPDGHEYCANGFHSHNTKIRGFRANVVIADEFASIPEDVFDIVVRGFAATAKTPVEEAKKIAFDKKLAKIDLPPDIKKKLTTNDGKMHGNQIIYSGTAYYAFNHFSKKHDMWQNIIRSKGDPDKVAQIFGGENLVPDGFSHKDYCIIRIPHTHLPDGLLDKRQLAHAKATLPRNIYLMEYGAVFVKDSDGFYSRSLIEGCTVGPNKPIETPDGAVTFTPLMRGNKGPKYVMGVDPAAERDNLAVTITEVWANHYRVVYCWVVNKKEFIKRKERGLITDEDYYAYCCSRIREIVKLFDPVRIEMDSQGGGYAIAEMLRNKKLFSVDDGDFPIYEIIDDDPKQTDGETDGRHILHLVKQSSEFNQEANIALHKSLETRTLLFPAFDSVKMYSAIEAEKSMGVLFDTYEENVFNLEELKNELCTIQMSETATGRERFDTPQVVQPGAVEGRKKRGRLCKDRYTALLLSHKYIYDTDIAPDDAIDYEDVAGNIEKREKANKNEPMYRGPGVGRMRNAQDTRQGGIFKAIKRGKQI